MRNNKYICYLVSAGSHDTRVKRGTLSACIAAVLEQQRGSICEITRNGLPFKTYTVGEDGTLWERSYGALPGMISDWKVTV